MFNNKRNKGFTLIELLVVISIIGLLSTVVLASLTSARKKAQTAKFVAEMNQLKTAFELYRNDNGQYPFEDKQIGTEADEISYLSLTTNLPGANGKGLNDELVTNKYISTIPNISQCPTVCDFRVTVTPEDYGYITKKELLGGTDTSYHCGGIIFKNYLFYVGNNQISPNYPHLGGGYDNYYCFGQ